MNTNIGIGDRIAFRRQFCRDTGQVAGWVPFARGVVIAIVDTPLFKIRWDGPGRHRSFISFVNKANLVREDQVHLEEV